METFRFLRSVLASIPALIHIRDQSDGKVLWCNDEWERALHIPKQEFVQHSQEIFTKIIHPEDVDLLKVSNDYYRNGETNNFGGVIRVKFPGSGEWRWLVGISRVIKMSADKIPLQTLAVFIDFSEVYHTRKQIRWAFQDVLRWHYKDVLDKITNRERQVMQLVAKGFSNEQIGRQLFISHHTVESHRKNIRIKLGIKNSAELIAFLKEIGI